MKALGTGAALGGCGLYGALLRAGPSFAAHDGTFGRLFNGQPFASQSPHVRAALMEMGRAGGILDAGSGPNPDNPTHTAGTTFMGQFMDHDMTFDASSTLGHVTQPHQTPNVRIPTFDLDSVYGRGPVGDPQLYLPGDRFRFKVESGGRFEDLPRGVDSVAVIADPRNDENMMISGLHAAFLLFHNNALDFVRSGDPSLAPAAAFQEARRLTTWHYQWMVLHEFLPLFVGQPMVDAILMGGRQFYLPPMGEAFIPVEFQAAAYRMGHSMVRPGYRANSTGNPGDTPFAAGIFDPAAVGPDPNALNGGFRAPRRFIGWRGFFDFGDGLVQRNKKIDTKLSSPLFNLPLPTIPGTDGPTSLAQRNLLRHMTWKLPSGQNIAQEMGVTPLGAPSFLELVPLGQGFQGSTPLWYYILKEAELLADGLTLGPVGGRIVGEVIIGILQTDPASFVNVQPGWLPTLGNPTAAFRMRDFLTFAGVDGVR